MGNNGSAFPFGRDLTFNHVEASQTFVGVRGDGIITYRRVRFESSCPIVYWHVDVFQPGEDNDANVNPNEKEV